jgi:signal transduction histidine kinase
MAARLPDPTAEHAVEDGMFRVLAWLRLVVTANMLGFALVHRETFVRPAPAAAVLTLLVLWTLAVTWWYADHRRRSASVLVADLAVAVGAILTTPWLKGEHFGATVPGFWVMAAVLCWAGRWGGRGGFVAAAAVAAADLGIRWPSISESNYGNVFLLLIGGPLLGRLGSALKDLAAERDAAQRAAALAEERARLGRAVHDGVLQVLALMQRKGPELGGDGVELGRLAAEQEARLRALLIVDERSDRERSDQVGERTELDLTTAVAGLAARRTPAIEVSTPGTPLALPTRTVEELVAATGACLDNVARHVGEGARAWVLVEDLGSSVVVTVRDEGPGIPEGRLEAAVASGRLGVSQSIRGRLRDLGGDAHLATGPHGTEWELVIPRLEA